MLPQRKEIANVVVCEDDTTTLELLCEHLIADRYGVLPAPSAADALRLCRYKAPDLMLLDLALPDAGGLDVLREIREADGASAQARHFLLAGQLDRQQRLKLAATRIVSSAGIVPRRVSVSVALPLPIPRLCL